MTHLWTIRFISSSLTLWLLFVGGETTAGSLYRCVTDTEGTIYTDNPAQLEHCSPITASGAVTSLATVPSGGSPAGVSPVTPMLPEPTMMPPPPSAADQAIAGTPPPTTTDPLPCPVGMNPLNPFSSPPCPTNETVPAATITMPSGPDAQP